MNNPLVRPKTYATAFVVAFLIGSPTLTSQDSTARPLGPSDACALEASCKPMNNWDCIHGTVHIEGKCDPLACQ